MNTEHKSRPRRGRKISLNASETIVLERPQAGERIEQKVEHRIIRIAANQSKNTANLTLAFACKADTFKSHYPEGLEITIEAITNTTYFIQPKNETESNTSDTIMH